MRSNAKKEVSCRVVLSEQKGTAGSIYAAFISGAHSVLLFSCNSAQVAASHCRLPDLLRHFSLPLESLS
jgi:hypothetical protein